MFRNLSSLKTNNEVIQSNLEVFLIELNSIEQYYWIPEGDIAFLLVEVEVSLVRKVGDVDIDEVAEVDNEVWALGMGFPDVCKSLSLLGDAPLFPVDVEVSLVRKVGEVVNDSVSDEVTWISGFSVVEEVSPVSL